MIRHSLLVMLITLFTTGCAAQQGPIVTIHPAAPCEEIIQPSLLSVPFNDLAQGREQAEQWILAHFPTATIDFVPSQMSGDTEVGRFSWGEDEKRISLFLQYGTRYVRHIYQQYPTLGHVLRCFGQPEFYTLGDAKVGGEVPSAVRLDLWYPDRRLYFKSLTWGRTEIRRYDANSPLVGQVQVMPPGTVEEMIENGEISMQQYVDAEDALIQEWPEEFTALMLEE